MKKDSTDQYKFCQDCADENDAGEAIPNQTSEEECCCCCCCGSSSESEAENAKYDSPSSEYLGLEERKKQLLSSLTLSRTNRESVSIQNVLQFVEALTHSTDFLRRYYEPEDFCIDCLLSAEYDCCTSGMSNLDLSDNYSSNSCEICETSGSHQTVRSQTHSCVECSVNSNPSGSGKDRTNNRRERRRRRQRNIRHRLPRVVTSRTNAGQNNSRESRNSSIIQQQTERKTANRLSSVPSDCRHSECEECSLAEIPNQSKALASTQASTNDNQCLCEECVRGSSNTYEQRVSDCEECNQESSKRAKENSDCNCGAKCDERSDLQNARQCEGFDCCSLNCQSSSGANMKSSLKRQTTTDDESSNNFSTCCACSMSGNDSCDSCDCNEESANTDESCDECGYHPNKEKKHKK